MPEDDEEITENLLRVMEDSLGVELDDGIDFDAKLVADLGFTRDSLRQLAFTVNKDEYFKPLGVGLVPDDVTDCETVGELVELVNNELNNENVPVRRTKPENKKPGK